MIYGYLRVSSDDQDVNSQRLGVEQFCKEQGWSIDKYITDEGVSGGKNPDKRNLGPLLKLVESGDKIVCSEISRLGRDLYMVMDILHFCMEGDCRTYAEATIQTKSCQCKEASCCHKSGDKKY